MQVIGFSIRLSSTLLWIQIYRLGASRVDTAAVSRDTDFDLRTGFLSPSPTTLRRIPESEEVLSGSIYDSAYYSSIFEDGLDNKSATRV